jgi:hypothetical protein
MMRRFLTTNTLDLTTDESRDDDLISESSTLTTLESGDTPTLESDEAPTIQALMTACDTAEYDLIVAKIPKEHRVKIAGLHYVLYDPYRPKKSKKTAWYWGNGSQGIEVIRTSQSMVYILHI